MSPREWPGKLLDTYLGLEHVNGELSCPLAFLVNDVTSHNDEMKEAYEAAYISMNITLPNYIREDLAYNRKDLF